MYVHSCVFVRVFASLLCLLMDPRLRRQHLLKAELLLVSVQWVSKEKKDEAEHSGPFRFEGQDDVFHKGVDQRRTRKCTYYFATLKFTEPGAGNFFGP